MSRIVRYGLMFIFFMLVTAPLSMAIGWWGFWISVGIWFIFKGIRKFLVAVEEFPTGYYGTSTTRRIVREELDRRGR